MASYDDYMAEQELRSLQSKIAAEYHDAYVDIHRTASAYWADLKERYDHEYAAYVAGKYGYANKTPAAAKASFDAWYAAQIGRGDRWDKLRGDMAARVNEAAKAASAYINDTTPGIYALGANYQAFLIEAATGSADFTIYDERTVADLIQGKTKILPQTRVVGPANEARIRDQLNKALTSGILQGQPIDKIADQFQRVTDMNRNAAIRNARTAMTNAQNAGRQDTYERAEAMGIEMEKEWIATEDDRTRESHAELDGVRVPVKDPYPNGLMFPGDESSGIGEEYYNCRCTERAIITKYNGEPRESRIEGHEGLHDRRSYEKWLDEKRAAKMDEPPLTHADATARAMEAAEDRQEASAEALETKEDQAGQELQSINKAQADEMEKVIGNIENEAEKEKWRELATEAKFNYSLPDEVGSYYENGVIYTHEKDGPAVIMHELAHAADIGGGSFMIDGLIYKSASEYLDENITQSDREKDAKNILDFIGINEENKNIRYYEWAEENLAKYGDIFTNVSDIISAVTHNGIKGIEAYGYHENEKWDEAPENGASTLSAEILADYCSIRGHNNSELNQLVGNLIPNEIEKLEKAYEEIFFK